ncbi:MAG TPA: FtsX-like permease family protein [bacterium]|nr:FtsX-like permease family protein [bacterium]
MIRTGILLKLAFRNLLLHKKRSFFVMAILTIGCTGILLIGGFFQGVLTTLREQFIHGITGHLMVAKDGYYEHGVANPSRYLFPNSQNLGLERNRHVTVTIPRLQFGGLLITDRKVVSVNLIGVDPDREALMSQYGGSRRVETLKIVAGEDLKAGDAEGLLMGESLAKIMKVGVGDELSMIATTASGSVDGANFRVRGLFRSPVREFDNQFAKLNLAAAQKVTASGDSVTSVLVMLDETEATAGAKTALGTRLKPAGFEVLDWEERGDFYRNGRDLLTQIDIVVRLIFATLILFSIASSVNMTFFERIREFGTMMALGNTRSFIFLLITAETFLLGAMGVSVGLGVGALASLAVSRLDVMMPALPGATSGYEARIVVSAGLLIKVAVLGWAAAVASSLIVSMRARGLRIVQALGYV